MRIRGDCKIILRSENQVAIQHYLLFWNYSYYLKINYLNITCRINYFIFIEFFIEINKNMLTYKYIFCKTFWDLSK